MHLRPGLLAVLVALNIAALPGLAGADRVVVGSIRGDSDDRIRERVEATLRERVEVVPWSEFRAAYRGLDGDAIRSACRAVDALAIVIGDVQGRRRLDLRALSCETGEIAAESRVELRRGLPQPDALNAAVAAMFFEQGARSLLDWATRSTAAAGAPAVREAAPRPARAAASPAAPEPTPAQAAEVAPAPSSPSTEEEDAVASFLDSGRERVGRPRAHETAEDPEPAPAVEASVSSDSPALAFLEASVGATFATRSLDVVDRTGQTVAYSGGGYTELGAQATVFPIALLSRSRWAGSFGVTGSFSKGVAVPAATGTGLNVDALDGDVGVVGRIVLRSAIPIELRPQVGYGFRGFAIDWNPDIATFNYRFVRIGLDARAQLLGRSSLREGTVGALTVGLAGGYRIVTDLGEAAAAYGTDASGAGWDVGAYVSVLLGRSLQITAGGELTRLWATYDGAGSLERLAQSTDDMFPRGFLRAGIALR